VYIKEAYGKLVGFVRLELLPITGTIAAVCGFAKFAATCMPFK
jgi:hypothetical protein